MQQVIQEVLEGNFRYDNGSLDFSCLRIDLSVETGRTEEGSFSVYGPQGRVTKGYVISSDLRMECLTPAFEGNEEIFYRVNTSDLEAGEEIKGGFHIVSNQGEYYLPFSVVIQPEVIESSLGQIKNMFHFTNLARSNWQEALKMFYSKEFAGIFKGNDRQYYTAYKGLSAVPGNEHNLEEFLIEIHKKNPIEYIPEETQIKLEDPVPLSRYTLVINKNGWGYTNLKIDTEGDFLKVSEENVSEDAFLGNLYRLYYYIQDDRLHAGYNYGSIRLRSGGQCVTVPVTVVRHAGSRRLLGLYKEKKRIIIQLMEYYQAFRVKKISTKTWLKETEKLLGQLAETDNKDISVKLFKAQLLITADRFDEAEWILIQNQDEVLEQKEDNPAVYGYYLYLTTLLGKEKYYNTEETVRELTELYERNKGNWRLAWLLLYVPNEYRSVSRKWMLLEELFQYRCNSPVVYIEAWNLLCQNPAMLLKLGEFELQILNYAVKQELMKEDILIQLLYLAPKHKTYSGRLFAILAACYEENPRNDILHAICVTLIKGNLYGPKYFRWYQAGVEQNLRITRLYEYYMMSLDLSNVETLPKMILLYFSYQSSLSYEITACLYAYVIRHKEEQPDIYISYLPSIERFVLDQLRKGRIDIHLAYLYRQVLSPSMIDGETANQLITFIHMREIEVPGEEIKQIVLVYPYLQDDITYPVVSGRALVPVYDRECQILLEDGEYNRYSSGISCQSKELMTDGNLANLAVPFVKDHIGYDISVCFENGDILSVQSENAEAFRRLSEQDILIPRIRYEIRMKLIQYYYEKDRMRELDEYLLSLHPGDLAVSDCGEMLRIMILRGLYPEAFEWLKQIGPYQVDAKSLVKLCGRILEQEEILPDPLLTGTLYYAVKKGKYDDPILRYLIRNFEGSIKDMRDIWKAACDFGVDTYELCERMLIQMLYTGAHVGAKTDILRAYIKGGGKDELIAAFISQCAYEYVVKEHVTDPYLLQSIGRLYQEGQKLHLVCQIAYLKYYAENKEEITKECEAFIVAFLQELLQKKIILPFYREFQGYLPSLEKLADKLMIEYHARPGHRAVIHYMMVKEDGTDQEYRKEEMKDMFGGICVKEFVLFFGEKLQYYITEEEDGVEQLTESGSISGSDISSDLQESRFAMLNDIMIGRTLQDYDTVDHLLEEYYRKNFMADKLFTIR